MILTANDFLKNYGVWLAVALVVIIAVVILILVLQKGKKKIKKGEECYEKETIKYFCVL